MHQTRRALLGAGSLLAMPNLAGAQATWPERPIRYVIGAAAGACPTSSSASWNSGCGRSWASRW
ncbi:hypothetical protein ACFQY5_27585 [Paeniroseomonas aquatica]|uniref:hypothetical protein n=1 Tax=Paeniroseomonas aquatica TaxID=373043 RepID=UPI0036153579